MSAKHTPGPWMIEDGTANSTYISSQKQKQFCSVWGGGCTDPFLLPDEWRANANLISAAPELLEGVEKDVARFGRIRDILAETMVPDGTAKAELMDYVRQCQIESRALITRAEGGQS